MSDRLRYAVICTRNRPDAFARCLAAIQPQVDAVLVVAHMSPPYVEGITTWNGTTSVCHYDEDPPNISRMWNAGLRWAAEFTGRGLPFDVAVLNDDAIVAPDWFETITTVMRTADAAAGSADQHGRIAPGDWSCNVTPKADDLHYRMVGFAFIIDGTAGLTVDEQFQWWAGDRDLEMVARTRGGVVLVGGCPVEHLHPNSTTVGELARIAGEDLARFETKWGFPAT